MKKSLLAIAAISFAGAAAAQSSVTLFGIVDAAYAHISAGGKSRTGMTNGGLNTSRLGFRGTEDMGSGLKANFWLEGQLNNDVGQGGSQTTGLDFRRRAYVGLSAGFGEFRLGREYTPTFWNATVYDAFGTVGVGSSNGFAMLNVLGVGNSTNAVRADNMITYLTPPMGGFNAQVMVSMGENGGATGPGCVTPNLNCRKTNNYLGGRVGYAAGPLSVHGAYGETKASARGNDTKYTNFGASYDLGFIKPMLFVGQEKTDSGASIRAWNLGVFAPIGQHEVRASVARYDIRNSSNDWNKYAVGYGYNLSKRTQLYGTYARVDNKGRQVVSVQGSGLTLVTSGAGAASPGGNASGQEIGIRHIF